PTAFETSSQLSSHSLNRKTHHSIDQKIPLQFLPVHTIQKALLPVKMNFLPTSLTFLRPQTLHAQAARLRIVLLRFLHLQTPCIAFEPSKKACRVQVEFLTLARTPTIAAALEK